MATHQKQKQSIRLSSKRSQLTLFGLSSDMVVNVASVKQVSPFRYPGGKTWFVPHVRQWLASLQVKPQRFVEPFAGGAIVGLTVAAELLAHQVVLIEIDSDMVQTWKAILGGHATEIGRMIVDFKFDESAVRDEVNKQGGSDLEVAFRTILKNRTFHGGILAKGSSLMKFGENGKGMASRWYPQTLAERLNTIEAIRHRISFIAGDALAELETMVGDPESVFFVDPPYTAAGKKAGNRLYNHHELDHNRLFDLMAKVKGDFVMTYDVSEELQAMAKARGFATRFVPMKNTHNTEMSELVIGRNLDWLR